MAKKKNKEYKALVSEKVGSNKDGSPKIVFEKGKPVENLTPSQIKFYKQIKYIE